MNKYSKYILSIAMTVVLGLAISGCGSGSNGTYSAAMAPAVTSAPTSSGTVMSSQVKSDSSAKTFTKEELKKYDGKNGNPAYVAVNGKVYDVTNIKQWMNGAHHGQMAGNDLSEAIKKSPHGLSVLDKLPVVGTLAN